MVLSIVSIASLCIAIYLSAEHEMLILHLDSCSIGLFFMIIGYLVKPLLNLQIKTKYMILVGITLFILYVLYMNISGCLIIYCNVWGRFPVVDAIGTTMGLLMVCVLSKILFFSKELKYVNLVLSYIANNALVILSFHFVIIEYLKIFISPDVIYDSFYQVVYLLLCILILPLLNMLFNDKLRWMIGK